MLVIKPRLCACEGNTLQTKPLPIPKCNRNSQKENHRTAPCMQMLPSCATIKTSRAEEGTKPENNGFVGVELRCSLYSQDIHLYKKKEENRTFCGPK